MPTQGEATQEMPRYKHSKTALPNTRRPQASLSPRRNLTALPPAGRGRWSDIAPFVGVSRETWRQLVNTGRAPTPLRLTERCSLYDFAAVHAWISDPGNYCAAPSSDSSASA